MTGRRSRVPHILLALSLAANLAVAGLLLGAWLSPHHAHDGGAMHRAGRDVGLGPVVMALPEDRRRAMAARLRAEAPGGGADRAALRAGLDRLLAAIRAEPFDPEALRAAMDAQRELAAARQAGGEALLIEELATMDVRERGAFADRLDRAFRRGGDR